MILAWKSVEQLNPEIQERKPEIKPRLRLVVAEAGETPALRSEVKGAQAGTPAPPVRRVLFVLEEAEARLLGVKLENFPETPTPVKINLEIL